MNIKKVFEKIFLIFLIVFILGVIGFFAFYLPFLRITTDRKEFDGVVLDKWVNTVETEQGSRPVRHILVKPNVGEPFDIIVDADTYNTLESGTKVSQTSTHSIQISK